MGSKFARIGAKKRPNLQEPSGYATASTTKWDGDDAVAATKILKGLDSTYAIPRDAINADLRSKGEAYVRLFGWDFCRTAETFLYLGEDETIDIGGASFSNTNAVTFSEETSKDESPLYLKTVADFVAASSQYLSFATASSVQLGTGSASVGIAFKTSTTSTAMRMFSYGDVDTSEQNYQLGFTSTGAIYCQMDDGTNTSTVTDSVLNYYQDGEWHFAEILLDTSVATDTMYLLVDGKLIGSSVQALGTLDNIGENLYLGCEQNNVTTQNYFTGSLALFRIVPAFSFNFSRLWQLGIREASVTTNGAWSSNISSSARQTTYYEPATSNNSDYIQTVLDTEDGLYDFYFVYRKSTSRAKVDITIDDTVIGTADQYNGSSTFNNSTVIKNVKLTSGKHVLKLKANGKNASSGGYVFSIQWILFIKRDGHEQNGSHEFLLLGDEVAQRQTDSAFATAVNTSGYYLNSFALASADADGGEITEGIIYAQGGLWRLDFSYPKNSSRGILDMDFGNVEVLDQLDEYAAGSSNNNTTSMFVRLNQGRNNIRLVITGKNGSSSDYAMGWESLRGVRIAD